MIPSEVRLPWLKFAYQAYIFSEFRANASSVAKGAFMDLFSYSMMQVPMFSIPDDDDTLVGWTELSETQWLKVKDLVLSQFTLKEDGRYHCNMLSALYGDDEFIAFDVKDEQQQAMPPVKKGSSTERMRRKREREAAEKAARQQQALQINDCDTVCDASITDVTLNVTQQTVTCDAVVTVCDGHVTQANVTSDAQLVTNEGVGGELYLDSKQDLNLNKKNTEIQNAPTLETTLPVKRKNGRKSTIEVLSLDDLITQYDVNPQHAKDWLAFRDRCKAPLTQTAMEGLIRNAELAGITVAQAIHVCASKNWRGFDATWNFTDVIPMSERKNKSYAAINTIKQQLIEHGEQAQSAQVFLDGLIKLYGIQQVDSACLSALSTKPQDIPQYLGSFLKVEAKKDKTRIGQVNDAWPIMPVKLADQQEVQKLKEELDEFPY